jgi:flagellar biosynthesis/type III secretory pathway M-ring protein FliF/YscJ
MTFDAVWKFFTDNPLARWIAAAIVALLGWEAVKRHLKDAGRQAERQASAVKQAQIKEAVTTRTAEIINEERHHADAATAARDNSPGYPDADSVPDEISAILFRSEGRDKAG